MSHLIYQRYVETAPATTGLWIANTEYVPSVKVRGAFGYGIEDVFREVKVDGVTRIPAGVRPLRKRTWGGFFEDYRDRFGHPFVVEVCDVPGYTDVLVHIANWARDTKGCLSVGAGAANSFDASDKEAMITESTLAYRWAFEHVFLPLLDTVEHPLLEVRNESHLLR